MYKIDREKVFWRKVDDQLVVLNMDTGFYYTLDETAVIVWDLVIAGKDLQAITAGLTESYEVGARIAKKDAESLLGRLQKEGLIGR